MRQVSPEEKLAELVEIVALLGAPASEQEHWAETNRYPAEEIALQFYDGVPAWFPHLRSHDVLDESDEQALLRLNDFLIEHQTKLFLDGPSVTDAPEWETVRALADAAVGSLLRPQADKGLRSS